MMATQVDVNILTGGLDIVTPAIMVKAGQCLLTRNYEAVYSGGYRRIDGFERFDGRPTPSRTDWVYVPFDGGTVEPTLGQVVTAGAVSGDLIYFTITSGAWATNNAEGHLIVGNVTGGQFSDNDNLTFCTVNGVARVGDAGDDAMETIYDIETEEFYRDRIQLVPGSGKVLGVHIYKNKMYAFRNTANGLAAKMFVATASGWSEITTPALLPNGKYRFVNYNFFANTDALCMYGADGVNKSFQFDGTVFTQITTGMATDTPEHIFAHKNHLFLSFAGSSLQHSVVGEPLNWSGVDGAGELGIGDDITGLTDAQGGVLVIFCRNKIDILYGNTLDDWELRTYNANTGAVVDSIQSLFTPFFLSERGGIMLNAAQDFGDFTAATFTKTIDPWLNKRKKSKVLSSTINREKGQYRLFFSDNTALYATFDRNSLVGMMTIELDRDVCCTTSLEIDGGERLFFGSSDGFVYEMDAGTSFDGEEIISFIKLAYNNMRSLRNKKRFRKVILDVSNETDADIQMFIKPEFSYGSTQYADSSITEFDITAGAGYWNVDEWGSVNWGEQGVGQASARIDGIGTNISLLISSRSTYDKPHTITTMTIHYDVRGLER